MLLAAAVVLAIAHDVADHGHRRLSANARVQCCTALLSTSDDDVLRLLTSSQQANEAMEVNHYEVLRVPRDADKATIRNAYLKLACVLRAQDTAQRD